MSAQLAIKAGIALLLADAESLADGVSLNGIPQWADEPDAKTAHDNILVAAANMGGIPSYIAELEAQNAELLAALKVILEVFGDEFGPHEFESIDLARAVIAKATGSAA